MSVILRGFVAALLLSALHAAVVHAQRPPKYVRTPYVEVYRDEFGGKHIRTPFAEIHKPGRIPPALIGPPVYAVPVNPQYSTAPQQTYRPVRPNSASRGTLQPTPAVDFNRMDGQALQRTIQTSTQRLENELAQVPGGTAWTASLRTSEIAQLTSGDRVGPPAESTRQQLAEIADVLDALSADKHAAVVTDLPSFRNLRLALRAYSASPGDRSRGQLLASADQLARSLERFDTAPTWLRYFGLMPGGALSSSQAPAPSTSTADLLTLLGKFDSVSRNPQYSMIAELPEFQQTHQLLGDVISEQPQNTAPAAEELPPPLPAEI